MTTQEIADYVSEVVSEANGRPFLYKQRSVQARARVDPMLVPHVIKKGRGKRSILLVPRSAVERWVQHHFIQRWDPRRALTDAQVLRIRQLAAEVDDDGRRRYLLSEIARRNKVSLSLVSYIVKGEKYADVVEEG